MTKEQFDFLLKEANLSKKEFAGVIGTSAGTVSNWGSPSRDIPYWVESWLNLYIENKKCKDLKQMIKDSGVCE